MQSRASVVNPSNLKVDLGQWEGIKLNQVTDNNNVQWALVDENLKAIHIPIICKDYLSDLFWSEAKKETITQYGFPWTPGFHKETLDKKWYLIAMIGQPNELLKGSIALVNFVGSKIGIPNSTIEYGGDVVRFHRSWSQTTEHISLFMLMMRIGLSYDGNKSPEEFLTKLEVKDLKVRPMDAGIVIGAAKQLKEVIEGTWKPLLQFTDLKSSYEAHVSGFFGYRAKEENIYGTRAR